MSINMKELLEDLKRVYQMLADEESRVTYLSRLNFLISGDAKFMDQIVEIYLPELPRERKTSERFLSELPAEKNIVLFGAGLQGREALKLICDDPRFVGFCSSTREKQRNGFLGYAVMSPEELLERKDLSVIISADEAKKEIFELLCNGGYPEEMIFTLDGLFTSYNEQYFGTDFIRYEDEEVFIDDGCYNLRSSIALREHCRRVKRVYAFEPDPDNYRTCLRNKTKYQFPEAELFPFGTWSEQTTLHFSGGDLSASHVSETGNINIPVQTIDEIVDPNERVTFIKMDVEGSELESLKGAKNTIIRDKPKLAICIYHKPEDMAEIPLYIKTLVPEYKFYIRHHSNNAEDGTVLYAVMGEK